MSPSQKIRAFQQSVDEACARVQAAEQARTRWTPPADGNAARAHAAALRAAAPRPPAPGAPSALLRDVPAQLAALQRARAHVAPHLVATVDDLTAR